MRVGGTTAGRKSLLQLAVGIDGVVIVLAQEINISRGQQFLLEKRAGRGGFTQLSHDLQKAIVVIGSAGNLAQVEETLCIYFRSGGWNRFDNLFGLLVSSGLAKGRGQRQLHRDA